MIERRELSPIIEKLEKADELLSQELDHFTIRPRKVREARDIVQEALDEFENLLRETVGSVSAREGETLQGQLE